MLDNILSSASLLLAVVGVLFGLWYPEAQNVLHQNIPKFKADSKPLQENIKNALFSKTIPLNIMTLIVVVIFMPETIKIISDSIRFCAQPVSSNSCIYDSARTAMIVVEVFSCAIFLYSISITKLLCAMLKRLQQLK